MSSGARNTGRGGGGSSSSGSGSQQPGNASENVQRMIKREQEIIDAARRLRSSARNKTVRSQCDSQIREATRNITYLEQRLQKLTLDSSDEHTRSKSRGDSTTKTDEPRSLGIPNGKVTRLDLFRWDRPATMGPRIKLMLQQLEYKTSIEQQYEHGTRKMIELYRQTGDRHSQNEAHANLAESTAKMALLKRSKKRYSDMNLATVLGSDDDEAEQMIDSGFAVPNVRRPLTGVLKVFVQQVEEVDHTIAWADQVEMWVTMKVENNSAAVARTRASRSSMFEEHFTIPVDKGNEIEFTVYDRSVSASQSSSNPVALLWLRISDIAEAIRQNRVERELRQQTGWASAAKVQELNANGMAEMPTGPPTNANTSIPTTNGAPSTANGGPNSTVNGGPSSTSGADVDEETVEGWFTLEPAGRIYLRLGFEKTGTNARKRARVYEGGGQTDLARLGRHNAIRKREETQQVHGHEFVYHQVYNVVRCSVCGDFTTSYFQCQECHLTVDRKCFSKIVTKCTALMSQDPDEELNHRIPHHWEPTMNMKAAWCAQCGFILPIASRKAVRKCTECGIMVHTSCAKYVPDLCGMSMEMAAQVVNEITSTRIRQATKAAAVNMSNRSQTSTPSHSPQQKIAAAPPQQPPSQIGGAPAIPAARTSPTKPKTGTSPQPYGFKQPQHSMVSPPPKAAPVRRKQVPGFPPDEKAQRDAAEREIQNHVEDFIKTNYHSHTHTHAHAPAVPKEQPPWQRAQAPQQHPQHPQVQQHPQQQQQHPQQQQQHPQQQHPQQFTQVQPQLQPPAQAQRPRGKEAAAAAAALLEQQQQHQHVQQPTQTQQVQPVAPKQRQRRRKVGLDDFSFLAVLGKGNFGKVMLAESKQTGQLYAVKVLKKNFIIDNREVESTRSEKRVFLIANRERHPFLINLFACFQTENRIYFVMDYVSGGDLMFHIQQKLFGAKRAQFYAAEVLLALKHFHDNDVIYRDLKLDNILLSLDGHIKVADYGLCKENMGYGKTTGTFCGTPDFIAPEILLDQKYGRSVDWWALGVLMYQMLLGKSPFHGNDEDEIYDAILSDEPLYPIHMPRDSVSILQQLLTRDPAKRLGSGPTDAEEIMAHPYFEDIDFDALLNLKITPPYKPEIDSPTDVRYFERDFTSEMPALTPMNSMLTPEMQEEFRGFSYSLGDSI